MSHHPYRSFPHAITNIVPRTVTPHAVGQDVINVLRREVDRSGANLDSLTDFE